MSIISFIRYIPMEFLGKTDNWQQIYKQKSSTFNTSSNACLQNNVLRNVRFPPLVTAYGRAVYLFLNCKEMCSWNGKEFSMLHYLGPSPSKKYFLFAPLKSPLNFKNDEKCFLFFLFVLKIFKFLSWLFGHIEKVAWLEGWE